eukprot:m.377337 g.377337  ORF g.377337 m.377337 type:complete len:52 (-) comp86462_c0_seq1:91-246(-)
MHVSLVVGTENQFIYLSRQENTFLQSFPGRFSQQNSTTVSSATHSSFSPVP